MTSSHSSDTIQTTRTCSTYGTFGQFRKSQHYQVHSPHHVTLAPNVNSDANACLLQDSSEVSFTTSTMPTDPDILTVTPLSSPVVSPSVCSTLSRLSSSLSSHSFETQAINHSGYAGDIHSMSAVSLSQYGSAISLPSLAVSRSRHDRKASSVSADACSSFPLRPTPLAAPNSMSPQAELPRNLTWLKDTVVEILIDQEGFRSITPTFRFAGYSTNTRSLDSSEKVIEGGAAQFVPISRQTFNFHYAPFDGQPVLRRISINGTSRDHVSRQATMSLKSNGVYTVRGSETSTISSKGASGDSSLEAPKLRWKFDYFVDDRRGSGKVEGEKTFTPLTFSCSPLLFHPLQGKKIRLMHVMKKNVVTKLVAEKMELPRTTSSRSPSPLLRDPGTSSPPLARVEPSKAHIWNLHRRLQSHGHSSSLRRSESTGMRVYSPLGVTQVKDRNQRELHRHRRASSAGEIGGADISHDFWNVDKDHEGKARNVNPVLVLSTNSPLPRYDRHILPPSKLSELLENIENIKPNVEFTGLSPAPRGNTRALALR
ncbi:hypothetical protein GGU11DRAFT_774269 [Lentinula aff. detonsa]|nr:hypothetical protein GGU11DRAFT_774269 [Lentinula aff. detonsa]